MNLLDEHTKSSPNSPIELVLYGDYQCPFCREAFLMMNRLEKDFNRDFFYVYRNFPLVELHPDSWNASKAAEAAALQNRFWDMHELLYLYQDDLSEVALFDYAERLGLDMNLFYRDYESEEVAVKIHGDFIEGFRKGVSGTPTVYINNRAIAWDGSYEMLHSTMVRLRIDHEQSFDR